MFRLLPAVVIALGLFASASLAEEEFVDAVNPGDVVYANYQGASSWWKLSLVPKNSVTEDLKKAPNYYRVVKVTNRAVLLRTLSSKSELWILWHAVSDISRTVEVEAKPGTK